MEGETKKRFLIGLKVAGLALLGPVFLWFLGWVSAGDDLLLVRWGAYGAPWIALVALFAASILFVARARRFAVVATILALLILIPVLPRLNPLRWKFVEPSDILRVMTFNASAMNSDFPAIAELIVDEKPDIIFLQQLANLPALQRAIHEQDTTLHYFVYPETTNDTLILARFHLFSGHIENGITTANVMAGKCRISLWSLHAPHGQYGADGQAVYFESAAATIHNGGAYVIAGGDLNSTEFNSVQAPLREELTDSYAQSGLGFGFTFPSHVRRFGVLGRLFRIDHVFARGMTSVKAFVTTSSAGSDHYPVTVFLARQPTCI